MKEPKADLTPLPPSVRTTYFLIVYFYTHICHYHPFTAFTFCLSSSLYLSPSLSPHCCLHFPLSSPAVDRIGVRAFWPVEQVTALTGPRFRSCAFCHFAVCQSHFNNVNMGHTQARENILCLGAHSLEPRCTPEPHMYKLTVPLKVFSKLTLFGFRWLFNTELQRKKIFMLHIKNSCNCS